MINKYLPAKNNSFTKIWSAQILTQFSINLLNFVLIIQIYNATKSTIATALLWVFYGLPAIFASPISGIIIDSIDKKKIMFASFFFQSITIFCFAFTNNNLYFIYILVFIYSTLNQFYLPAEASIIPQYVKKKDLGNANSLLLLTSQIAFVFGFGAGGILVSLISKKYLIIFAGLLVMVASLVITKLPKREKELKKSIDPFGNWLKKLLIGWEFITQQKKLVMYSFAILAIFQLTIATIGSILPVLSFAIFSKPLTQTALWMVLPASSGLIIGGWFFSKNELFKRKNRWIKYGILFASIALCSIAFMAKLPLLTIQKSFILALLLLIIGTSAAFIFVPTKTFIQENTPSNIRGRVFSLLNIILSLSTIPPLLFIATIIDILGILKFLFIIGLAGVALSVLLFKKSEQIIVETSNRS